MLLTYRYKLMPTRAQHALLDRLCEDQRQLYNAALQERIDAWKKAGKSVTKLDQFKSLTQIRGFDQTYALVPVSMSRWSIARVDDAFKGFFSRVKRGDRPGFPRFRSFHRWRSFGFVEWDGVRLIGRKILSKPFGTGLKLKMHRELPDGADIKSCTFTKRVRHWHVTMAVDVPVAEVHVHPDREIGLDVGVEHLVSTSDGLHVENVRPRKRREAEFRRAQRALARCRKGSKRRRKVRDKLAGLQRRIADVRSTYLHQVSARIARDHGFIAVEKLKVRNMTRSAAGTAEEPGTDVSAKAGLNREMLDASFGRLVDLLSYKAERAGGILVKVDPKFTSQDCSSCGTRVAKTLAVRTHRCACGAVLHRDVNAAKNILQRALEAHGRARPPGDANVGRQPVRRLGKTDAKAA